MIGTVACTGTSSAVTVCTTIEIVRDAAEARQSGAVLERHQPPMIVFTRQLPGRAR